MLRPTIFQIGKYNWFALKKMGNKYFLLSETVLFKGYYSLKPCDFAESKLSQFLRERFSLRLEEQGVDTSKLGDFSVLTKQQYETYVYDKLPASPIPYLLQTLDPNDTEMVYVVNEDESIDRIPITKQCGIRPCLFMEAKYAVTLTPDPIVTIDDAYKASLLPDEPSAPAPDTSTSVGPSKVDTTVPRLDEKPTVPIYTPNVIDDEDEDDKPTAKHPIEAKPVVEIETPVSEQNEEPVESTVNVEPIQDPKTEAPSVCVEIDDEDDEVEAVVEPDVDSNECDEQGDEIENEIETPSPIIDTHVDQSIDEIDDEDETAEGSIENDTEERPIGDNLTPVEEEPVESVEIEIDVESTEDDTETAESIEIEETVEETNEAPEIEHEASCEAVVEIEKPEKKPKKEKKQKSSPTQSILDRFTRQKKTSSDEYAGFDALTPEEELLLAASRIAIESYLERKRVEYRRLSTNEITKKIGKAGSRWIPK